MSERQRLSATVQENLIDAARLAVEEGRASSVSAWVNTAMQRQSEHDIRLRAVEDFVTAFEDEHGTITDREMADAVHRARGRAITVRDPRPATA